MNELFLGAVDMSAYVIWEESETTEFGAYSITCHNLPTAVYRDLYSLWKRGFEISIYMPPVLSLGWIHRIRVYERYYPWEVQAKSELQETLWQISGTFKDGNPF